MTILEEVKRMQQQGATDEHIIQTMREKGADYKDIADSLAQSRIKAAVEQPDMDPSSIYPGGVPEPGGSQETMERSIMSNQPEPELAPPTPGAGEYASPQGGYMVQQPQEYNAGQYAEGYNQQQYTASSDLTTEIAEQVVSEKLGELRRHLEKVADMKTTVEARIEYLDERLKRIEKMMDTLQSSILRKVGDYVTNVDDIKREMVETQKTFAKLLPGAHKQINETRQQSRPHHQGHHSQQHKR